MKGKKGLPSDHIGRSRTEQSRAETEHSYASCPCGGGGGLSQKCRIAYMADVSIVSGASSLPTSAFHSDGLICSRLALWEGPGCSCTSIQALELLDSVEGGWQPAALHGGAATLSNERLKHG